MIAQPKWSQLSHSTQNLYLKVLWNDRYTESAIAAFLQTTKGRVVRRRATLKLANTEKRREHQERRSVDPERFWGLVELEALRVREEGDEDTAS